jgi:HNH endonuclease
MKRYKDTPYFVTEDGKVIGSRGYELKLNSGKSGYAQISNKKLNKTFSVHRMIAETYIPNPENKTDVNHINGIKTDNRISNLEWVSRSENMMHSVHVLGKKYVGKLSEDDIQYIKNNYKPRTKGSTQVDLAKRFGVTQGAIKYFLNK